MSYSIWDLHVLAELQIWVYSAISLKYNATDRRVPQADTVYHLQVIQSFLHLIQTPWH